MPMLRKGLFAAIAAVWLAAAPAAHAVAVSYEGALAVNGAPSTGQVQGSSFFGPADRWDFWTFTGTANDRYDVTVQRLAPALDPFFGVWFGQEADTASYFDMGSDSLATTWFGFGDDELAPFTGSGAAGDAALTFTALGTGTYVVAVGGAFAPGTTLAQLPYRITVGQVPEPGVAALMLAGLGMVGAARRRRGGMRP